MKKEKNAAKPKTKRPAKPKKEPVSQWMTNPLNEQVLDYHNYEMTQGEQVLYFILAFLIGGVVSQFFYGGLFQEDGAPTLLTYISNAAAFVVVGLIAGRGFLRSRASGSTAASWRKSAAMCCANSSAICWSRLQLRWQLTARCGMHLILHTPICVCSIRTMH